MTRLTILAVAAIALLFGAATFWPSRPGVSPSLRPIAAASFFEIHRNAHLDNLPAEEFDDQTFVFPHTAQRIEK